MSKWRNGVRTFWPSMSWCTVNHSHQKWDGVKLTASLHGGVTAIPPWLIRQFPTVAYQIEPCNSVEGFSRWWITSGSDNSEFWMESNKFLLFTVLRHGITSHRIIHSISVILSTDDASAHRTTSRKLLPVNRYRYLSFGIYFVYIFSCFCAIRHQRTAFIDYWGWKIKIKSIIFLLEKFDCM